MRLGLAIGILLLYWPLCLLPQPDGHATDLYTAGANFVSWFDRAVLGAHAYVKGPLGYDPEGILSTLPAVAQCLLGTLAGEWVLRAPRESVPRAFALAGVALAAVGLLWSPFFPLIKSIWTSSYVLLSTGLALLVWAGCFWLLDLKRTKPWGIAFVLAFGMNAIFAYVLHELASLMLAGDGIRWFDRIASLALPPKAAALVPVLVFLLIVWLPVGYLYRRHWIIRI
jgi:predicted acyltransferase